MQYSYDEKGAGSRTPVPELLIEEILAGISDGVALLDKDWRYTYLNEREAEIIGLPRSEVLGRSIWDLFPTARGSEFERHLRQAMEQTQEVQFLHFYSRSKRWLENRVFPAHGGLAIFTSDVTDRERAHAELRRSQERFKSLVMASAQVVWSTTADGRVIEDLPTWRAFTGQTEEEVCTVGWFACVHPEDQVQVLAVWQESMRTGAPHENTFRVRGSDGAYRSMLARTVPMKNAAGEVEEWVGTLTDVTELQVQETHRAELAAIVESSQDAVIGRSTDGLVTSWNTGAERMYGYTTAEVIGRTKDIIVPEDLREGAHELLERVLAGDEVKDYETVRLHKNGTPIQVSLALSPIKNRHGGIIGVSTIERDITLRKQAEEALREETATLEKINQINVSLVAELDYRKLVQAVTDVGCDLTGAQFGAFFYNSTHADREEYALYAVSGVEREQFEMQLLPQIAPLFDRTFRGNSVLRLPDISQEVMDALRGGKDTAEPAIRSYLAAPVIARSGEVLGGLFFGHEDLDAFTPRAERLLTGIASQAAIALDNARLYKEAQDEIADRKRAEAQLKELNETLELRVAERTHSLVHHQDRLRGLAAELAATEQRERRRLATELHDYLAQLLVVCRMKVGQLERKTSGPPAEVLNEIDDVLEEAIKYTRSLIVELSPTVLYESGLLAALEWLAQQMHRHGLWVELPDRGKQFPLTDDEALLLFQAVRELLFNVIKHAGVDRARVTVHQPDARWLVVTVEDEGRGFAPPEPAREETIGGKYGLFNIRERIEAVGGTVQVNSVAGSGAKVSVRIPITKKPPLPRDESNLGLLPPANPVQLREAVIHVLLVDDHRLVREGLRSILESYPDLHIVGEAADGEEAVEMARKHQPDAVIMDINMPRLNGIEATRRIHSQWPHITIIGLSVHDDAETAATIRAAGAADFLTKGGPSEDLYRIITESRQSKQAL